MALVRIEVLRGKSALYRRPLGHAVYEAMLGANVPLNDRFIVVSEHDSENFQFDPTYLGIERDENLVMVQITWNEGRTIEQKKALYKAICDGLAKSPKVKPENVLINLVEVKKENWSYGHGIAQYVS
ncbi:tautomerase family protein [Caballeronia novacaledonica]|uniref:Tautomerase family protein n=1 Tax=Caballeronia novacaledonica TaxID=1544861 RepID=A0AA37III3_9BURK|nr:tautomerase family protein [Caballeronia novacaledonica]GJH29963.1 tautomerase family protein [Caballeronia novacaledonica]